MAKETPKCVEKVDEDGNTNVVVEKEISSDQLPKNSVKYRYYKADVVRGRVIIREDLEFTKEKYDSCRVSMFRKLHSKYRVTHLGDGRLSYFNDIESANLRSTIHQITKEEYDMLDNITQLQTEIFMHSFTGGFPRDESVKSLVRKINNRSGYLLDQFNEED